MRRSYRSSWMGAALAGLLLLVQVVQMVVLRSWWWGWSSIASGVLLHTHLWTTIAASLVGTWFVRSSVTDGAALRLRTTARPSVTVVAAALWPAAIIALLGDVALTAGIASLGEGWFGQADWIVALAGPCWTMAGWLWGWWIGLHAPWKSAWLISPTVPLGVCTIGTWWTPVQQFLPLLPNANPFEAIPLVGKAYILVAAGAIFCLTAALATMSRLLPLMVGLVIGVIAVPTLTTVPVSVADPEAVASTCSARDGLTLCHPAAYAIMWDRINDVTLAARRSQPGLFDDVRGVTTVPATTPPGYLAVTPEGGWMGVSMLASDADLRLDLAVALVSSPACDGGELEPALVIRTATLLEAQGAALFAPKAQDNQLFGSEDATYSAAVARLDNWDGQRLGAFLTDRRSNTATCALTAQQFLATP